MTAYYLTVAGECPAVHPIRSTLVAGAPPFPVFDAENMRRHPSGVVPTRRRALAYPAGMMRDLTYQDWKIGSYPYGTSRPSMREDRTIPYPAGTHFVAPGIYESSTEWYADQGFPQPDSDWWMGCCIEDGSQGEYRPAADLTRPDIYDAKMIPCVAGDGTVDQGARLALYRQEPQLPLIIARDPSTMLATSGRSLPTANPFYLGQAAGMSGSPADYAPFGRCFRWPVSLLTTPRVILERKLLLNVGPDNGGYTFAAFYYRQVAEGDERILPIICGPPSEAQLDDLVFYQWPKWPGALGYDFEPFSPDTVAALGRLQDKSVLDYGLSNWTRGGAAFCDMADPGGFVVSEFPVDVPPGVLIQGFVVAGSTFWHYDVDEYGSRTVYYEFSVETVGSFYDISVIPAPISLPFHIPTSAGRLLDGTVVDGGLLQGGTI